MPRSWVTGLPSSRWSACAVRPKSDLKAFEDYVGGLAEVRECYMLNGEIDFLLKVVARDLQSFQSFLTAHLTSAPNVTSVKTSLTIRTAKQLAGIPVEP